MKISLACTPLSLFNSLTPIFTPLHIWSTCSTLQHCSLVFCWSQYLIFFYLCLAPQLFTGGCLVMTLKKKKKMSVCVSIGSYVCLQMLMQLKNLALEAETELERQDEALDVLTSSTDRATMHIDKHTCRMKRLL